MLQKEKKELIRFPSFFESGLCDSDQVTLFRIAQPTLRILFFMLSWWTVLRSNQSSPKEWISEMQLAVMSRVKYNRKRKNIFGYFKIFDLLPTKDLNRDF